MLHTHKVFELGFKDTLTSGYARCLKNNVAIMASLNN